MSLDDYFYLPDPLDMPVDPGDWYPEVDEEYPRGNDCE